MGEQTEVNPDQVIDFGKKTMDQLEAISNGLQVPMDGIPQAQPGLSGLAEGRGVFSYHNVLAQRMGPLVTDLIKTFQALGTAASVVGANYKVADLTQSNAMVDVESVFNPAPEDSAARAAERAAQEREARQRSYADEINANPGELPPATDSTPDTAADGESAQPVDDGPTAQERVEEHMDDYGGDEYDPEPTIMAPGPGYGGYGGYGGPVTV